MPGYDPAVMMLLLVTLLVPTVGILMALTPFLMRRGEVFAVTVPTAAQTDPFVVALKRRYAAIVGAATALFTAAGIVFSLMGNERGIIVVLAGGTIALCAGGYALMLRYRAKMQAYKRSQGWTAEAQEAVAMVGEQPVPRAISLKWSLLYAPVILVTVVIGIVGYSSTPDMIPMHMGFDGTVNRWEPKSPGHRGVSRDHTGVHGRMHHVQPLDHPEVEEMGRTRRAGHVRAGVRPVRPRAEHLPGGDGRVADGLHRPDIPAVGPERDLASPGGRCGDGGHRAHRGGVHRAVGGVRPGRLARVPEHAGLRAPACGRRRALEAWAIFYCNPDDASLFLPERFGIGWTFNLARPAVWALLVGGLLVTVAFIVAVMVLV